MKEHKVMISKAPDNPTEKKDWTNQMMRIQLAMYVDDGATCAQCGHTYNSVDDFMRCNPKRGYGEGMIFVCNGCWEEYEVESKN